MAENSDLNKAFLKALESHRTGRVEQAEKAYLGILDKKP